MFIQKRLRTFAGVLLALVLAAAAYGFAAENKVPNSRAGDGWGTVSGYKVSNVKYTLASDPSQVAGVSFDLDGSATSVYAAVGDNTGTWTWSGACSSTGNNGSNGITSWKCNFSPPFPVVNIYHLRVVATGP